MARLGSVSGGDGYSMNQAHREKGDTWPKVLTHNYSALGDRRKAMRYKHYGIWQPHTWSDYYLNVKYLALGLLALGFESGDKLLIVGDNAPQWYGAELAAQANHGVAVGVYSDVTAGELEYFARNSESTFAVVEDQEQVDKFLEIKDRLPLFKRVIYWNYKGLAHYDDPLLLGYREAIRKGHEFEEEHQGLFEKNVEGGKADDPCAIVYTSGTTGEAPKGAVHTHGSMMAGALSYLRLDPWSEDDNIVPFLPPAWMAGQWFAIGCHLLSGCILNFPEAPETQARDAREISPTIAFHGARVWESQAAMIQSRIIDTYGLKGVIFRLLMPVGYRAADGRLEKARPGLFAKVMYAFVDAVLFRGIRKSLGMSHLRICYSTGAVLSPDALRFYHAARIPVKSVYGTTEGGTLSGARNDDIRLGTVGPPLDGAAVKIDEGGELLYRQPGAFAGYYRDPEKTAAVMRDGWFSSGDSATIDTDGHVVFVDRTASLITLANGEEVAPQSIESRLRSSPYIKDAWVIADGTGSYLAAIVVINYGNVGKWAGQKRIAFNNFGELSQGREVYGLVRQDIDRANNSLPPGSRIKKFVNLPREFDPDEGELTKTRNLRRGVLEERYRSLTDAIYAGDSEVSVEAHVDHQDGREGARMMTLSITVVEGVGS
jgi:long-chain acyl-CoA synthetase